MRCRNDKDEPFFVRSGGVAQEWSPLVGGGRYHLSKASDMGSTVEEGHQSLARRDVGCREWESWAEEEGFCGGTSGKSLIRTAAAGLCGIIRPGVDGAVENWPECHGILHTSCL